MKKLCSCCGEERDAETDFRWEHKARDIRATRCKYCQSKLSRRHYQNNKQAYKKRSRLRQVRILSENRPRICTYLTTHPCVDCGETDIRLLEFDHVSGQKTTYISRLLTQHYTWSTIEAEIAKCEVRCVNCHRKRTFERDGDWWKAGVIE